MREDSHLGSAAVPVKYMLEGRTLALIQFHMSRAIPLCLLSVNIMSGLCKMLLNVAQMCNVMKHRTFLAFQVKNSN
jgi:hypothetical protein